jgi:hypothetical protein
MAWRSILEKHPEHVRLIGMIAIESGNLEIELAGLFARMLMIPLRMGRAVYLTPQAAHARLAILKNAAQTEFDRPMRSKETRQRYDSALKQVMEIYNRASAAINKRNRIVHDSWGFSEDDREVSLLMIDGVPDRESASVPINELKDQLSSMRKLIGDVGALAREFYRNPPTMIDLRLSGTPPQTTGTQVRRQPRPSPPKSGRQRRSLPE